MLTTLVHISYIYYIFKNYCTLLNIHISYIYHVSYPIIFKINVSICRIRVVSDTHIVYVHHIRSLNPYFRLIYNLIFYFNIFYIFDVFKKNYTFI